MHNKLNKLNEKNFLVKEKLALKEVKEFIEKNKEAYKKVYASRKIGAVTNFKEKVLPIKFFVKDKSKISVLFCFEFSDPSQSIY